MSIMLMLSCCSPRDTDEEMTATYPWYCLTDAVVEICIEHCVVHRRFFAVGVTNQSAVNTKFFIVIYSSAYVGVDSVDSIQGWYVRGEPLALGTRNYEIPMARTAPVWFPSGSPRTPHSPPALALVIALAYLWLTPDLPLTYPCTYTRYTHVCIINCVATGDFVVIVVIIIVVIVIVVFVVTIVLIEVTDEANQMSELAGAKEKGEDKVRQCSYLGLFYEYDTWTNCIKCNNGVTILLYVGVA